MTLGEILHFIIEGLSATAPVREELHSAIDALELDAKPKQAAKPATPAPPPLTAEQKAFYGITDDKPAIPAKPAVTPVPAPKPQAGTTTQGDVFGTDPLTVDDEIGELQARLTALQAEREGTTPAAGA